MYSSSEQSRLNLETKKLLKEGPAITKNNIPVLRDCLRFHEWKYYVEDNPVISDFEYDQLYSQLDKFEKQHPEEITADSPTQRVSSDITQSFESVTHLNPMLSLENSYNVDDLVDFDKRIRKLLELQDNKDISYFAEPKFDGGSIAIIYEDDVMVRAATRGDGTKGEEITANARTMKSLPLRTAFSEIGIRKVELRGEAVISKEMFEKVNAQRESDGLPLLANPRNAATGVLRVKDPQETSNRGIDVFIFQLAYAETKDGSDFFRKEKTHYAVMKILSELGFKVGLQDRKECKNIQEVIQFTSAWAEKRDHYPYEIDGVVVKVNSIAYQEMCGSTSHHPRWAVAHKFQAKQATSTLIGVDFQVGKIGSITPVAKIEPVQLAGVTVSSISLHNEDFITQRDIRYGDQVLVERAGDVIPYIVKSFSELRNGTEMKIHFPKECPVCNTTLIREEDEAAWRCPNFFCEAQQVQRLIHHVSKEAMDIDGLGKSLVERFYELGWLKNMADIYQLDYVKISTLEGMGEKSAEKLRLSIEKAKKNPIHRLLHGLCIHHLGKKVSKLIAEHLSYVPDLKNWNIENFTAIKDVGPVVGENIIAFFKNKENFSMIEKMEMLGVNMHQTHEDKPRELPADAPLSGKTILFTGTLTKMGRKEAQDLAEKAGAKLLSAVSANLHILVVGEDAGSKLTKAKSLGSVTIMTEDEFLKTINE